MITSPAKGGAETVIKSLARRIQRQKQINEVKFSRCRKQQKYRMQSAIRETWRDEPKGSVGGPVVNIENAPAAIRPLARGQSSGSTNQTKQNV
jgi:hypothetical protein